MAKLLEDYSKQLVREANIPVPKSLVAATPEEAAKCQAELGCPVVVKALVPVGKRGKAGAIKFANNQEEAKKVAAEILKMTVRYFPVEKVLVEEKIDIDQELFVSFTSNKQKKCPVVLISTAGGVDIEEVAAKHPDKLKIVDIDPFEGLPQWKCREIWSDLGLVGGPLKEATTCLYKLYKMYEKHEATTLEINPLVITKEGKVMVAASLMAVDDSAMFRHKDLNVQLGSDRTWRPLTDLEKKAVEVNELDPYRGTARYTEMDGGDIGFMCGGGGGSLLCFDTLLAYGGKPANYTEFGGNPPERKMAGLIKVILSKPGVKALIIDANVTNNTQVDLVARGVVTGLKELNIDPKKFPVVARLVGVNNEAGRKVFEDYGIDYCDINVSMSMACKRLVDKMKEVYGA